MAARPWRHLEALSGLLLGLSVGGIATAETVSFNAEDEGAANPAFVSFRNDFVAALASRDLDALTPFIHEDVQISYGEDNGREFLLDWLDDLEVGEGYWMALDEVTSLAGAFSSDGAFCAPRFVCQLDANEDVDPFEIGFVVSENVEIYSDRSTDSAVVETLSFKRVDLGPWTEDPDWWEIVVETKKTGFVEARHLRLASDFRVVFAEQDDEWRLVEFIEGG
jgi:hypothetical protein